MRLLPISVIVLGAWSLACAGGPKCGDDTVEVDGECVGTGVADADTDADTDADADADATIKDAGYVESGGSVRWSVEADGALGSAEIWIIETGDPAYEGGCGADQIGRGGIVCGVWSEHHTDFTLASGTNAYGGETLEIDLDVTDDYTDQASNRSTLFRSPFLETVTFLVVVTDPDGNEIDCASGGDFPGNFQDDCDQEL